MALIFIVQVIAIATIVGVLVWYALRDQNISCTTGYCTHDCNQGRNCTCDTFNFPKNRP